MKKRLFVDMDGTLAVFHPVKDLETLYEPGYFSKLSPIPNVVIAIRHIVRNHPEIEVFVLSAYLSDSQYALAEKNAWLNRYLPEIDARHRIFLPCGENKADYIPNGVHEFDFLLDDYTHNLSLWPPPGRGIKLLNGINHTKGSWQGNRLCCSRSPDPLQKSILAIMNGATIQDRKPKGIEVSSR